MIVYASVPDIYYAVLNSAGSIIKPATNLVGDGGGFWDDRPDAAQLSDGRIMAAWTGNSGNVDKIRFAVLDAAFNIVVSPITLINDANLLGDDYVSVAPSSGNERAVLTWKDDIWNNSYHLYYALVNSEGEVLNRSHDL